MQDAPAHAEIRRIFWVFWCSQVDPPGQFLLCRHIVANALHDPQTSTICRKQTVIKSVLWLWSNCSLVAAISWRMCSMCHKPAQLVGNGRLLNLFFGSGRTAHWLPRYGRFKLGVSGMCMYVHVCVGICVYVHVYIGICRYCQYMHVYACMHQYAISICSYCMHWTTGARKPPQRPQNTSS